MEILQPLGGGGMADVFLARQGAVLVAVKRPRASLGHSPATLRQFQQEATLGMMLRHPNVVRMLEAGADSQGPFLVMEYVKGVNAARLLSHCAGEGRQLPLEVALTIVLDAARGLAHAHDLGAGPVLHRDLTPDNLLIGEDGCTRVADFGIARTLESTRVTATGEVRGKLGYLAPEQFHGGAATVASDTYSLASTAFKLLCGVLPFNGANEAELLKAVLFAHAPQARALRSDVPPAISEWIERALERDPRARPSLAALSEQLCAALAEPARAAVGREVVAARGTQLPRVDAVARPARPQGRGRFLSLVAAAVLASVLGGWLWAQRAPPPAEPPAALPPPSPSLARALPPEPVDAGAPAASAAPTPGPKKSFLRLRAKPYAEVFIDGVAFGVTPLPPLALAPGAHHLILVNTDLERRVTRRVVLTAGRTTDLAVDLSKPDP